MITLILLLILILIIIWTAYSYLDRSFIDKYKNTFDMCCFFIIEPSLFYYDISIQVCCIIGVPCAIICIYSHFHKPQKLAQLSAYLFSENYLFWATPFTISKIFSCSKLTSDFIVSIIASILLLAYWSFTRLYKQKHISSKNNE